MKLLRQVVSSGFFMIVLTLLQYHGVYGLSVLITLPRKTVDSQTWTPFSWSISSRSNRPFTKSCHGGCGGMESRKYGGLLASTSKSFADDDELEISLSSTSSRSNSNNNNVDMLGSFVNGLWKGVTLPFPSLRGLINLRRKGQTTTSKEPLVGWSVYECLLAIAGYLAMGVVAYSYLFEKWSIVDSLYFSCVCFSTVGYGDLCPKSLGGRLFTCIFGLGGIVFLGTAVATIASHVVQAELEAAHVARQASRQRVLQFIDHRLPTFVKEFTHHHNNSNSTNVDQHNHLPHIWPFQSNITTTNGWLSNGGTILKRVLPSMGLVMLGGLWIGRLNGWNWMDSIYFSVVTASTIGLGDFAPSTRAARLWAIIFIPLSVATAGELLSSLATTLVQRRQKVIFRTLMERDLTTQHLQAMDLDHSGKVSREEYVQFMLLEMGHVSMDEIQELQAQFERLDVSKSGFLDQDDLVLLADLRKKNATL